MPVAASTYQGPAGAMPVCFQRFFSKMSVPELSPREMNVAREAAIARSASKMFLPRVCAGSAGGPTRTKSLCITSRRRSPFPCST